MGSERYNNNNNKNDNNNSYNDNNNDDNNNNNNNDCNNNKNDKIKINHIININSNNVVSCCRSISDDCDDIIPVPHVCGMCSTEGRLFNSKL